MVEFSVFKMRENRLVARAPWTPLRELAALPQAPDPLAGVGVLPLPKNPTA